MDADRFDRFARSLAAPGTRRRLVRLLAALPLGVTLTIGLGDAPDATAKKNRNDDHGSSHRRQRRKARRDADLDQEKRKGKGKGKGKHRRRPPAGCTPESAAQTCAGKCAQVPNNCGAVINCGPCACTPTSCPICQTCDASTETCLPDGAVVGQACGEPGQVCQAEGRCGCNAGSCGPCRTCQGDGTCSRVCDGSGCCDGSTCQPGTSDGACGTGGTPCTTCTGTGVSCGGGRPGVCGCTPTSCPVCHTCDAAGQCVADGAREGHGCGAGLVCQGGTCGCLRSTADLQAAITVAAAGATLTLCPGTWTLSSTILIAKNLTLVGAGAGQSILDGGNAVQVLKIDRDATVTVQDLTITKGRATGSDFPEDRGAGIYNDGTLTLVGVSVSFNTATNGGGIFNNGTLTLQDSRVMNNTAGNDGGIYNRGTLTLQAGSSVMNNTATENVGGIENVGGTVTLQAGSSVMGNTAVHLVGGIANGPGTLTLRAGSSVTGNTAFLVGGILNNQQKQGTVTLEPGSSVTGNSPDNCDPNIGSCI